MNADLFSRLAARALDERLVVQPHVDPVLLPGESDERAAEPALAPPPPRSAPQFAAPVDRGEGERAARSPHRDAVAAIAPRDARGEPEPDTFPGREPAGAERSPSVVGPPHVAAPTPSRTRGSRDAPGTHRELPGRVTTVLVEPAPTGVPRRDGTGDREREHPDADPPQVTIEITIDRVDVRTATTTEPLRGREQRPGPAAPAPLPLAEYLTRRAGQR